MSSALERIRVALASGNSAGTPPAPGRPVALGWATVELDRAAHDLGADLGLAPQAFRRGADSLALGARCRVARGALADGSALVVLEPMTEGRLAAILARNGEGPAVRWFLAGDAAAIDAAPRPPAR